MAVDERHSKFHPLAHQQFPLVFSKVIDTWPAIKWTPEDISHIIGDDTKIRFRIGPKSPDDIIWETNCCYEEATIPQYLEWLKGCLVDDTNPLRSYSQDKFWCYADYKYMAVMFKDKKEVLKSIDWSVFDLKGRGGAESTLWIGSEGAYTPCHYDTYGFNLVAQIYGRKRWILFPPNDTRCMYPTRLPYEESSVFSDVNIKNPDLDRHPKFAGCHPYVTTLEPGQVLFVPRHWWHLVESLETSISVNSWIEMDEDDEGRLEEAAARMLVTSLTSADDAFPLENWLNPTEEMPSIEDCKMYLSKSWECLNFNKTSDYKCACDSIPPKKQKTNKDSNCYNYRETSPTSTDVSYLQHSVSVRTISIKELFAFLSIPKTAIEKLEDLQSIKSGGKHGLTSTVTAGKVNFTEEYFLKCVTHPDVIRLICQIMKDNKSS